MGFTYAIGDAHGRLDLVEQALSLAEQHCGDNRGTFVCCGDFVDRGPESRMIINLFRLGPKLPNWKWVILAGNHEDMMALAARSIPHLNWWIGNGGMQTLINYGARDGMLYEEVVNLVPDSDIEWLKSLPVHYLDEHRAFVHAGFDPALPLAEQSRQHMTWMYPGPDPDDQQDYPFLGRHVVHGHVQHANGPLIGKFTTNIDTFAWLHGRLAVAVFDDAIAGPPIEILWAEVNDL